MNKTLEKTIVGATAPTNKNVLWIDSKNNLIKYNNNNKWLRTSNHSDDTLDVFLPRTGGTMKGNIDMNGNRVDNVGIEEVNSLPTVNLYEGRMVRFKNKTYTFYNGLWLALSDDLRGHANDTHEENFVYQPTASDLSVKDGFADIKKLKGNTLVWNQMFDYSNIINNNLATYDNSTGIFTCTPVNQSFILKTMNLAKKNHYHLISYEIKSDNNAKINVWNGSSTPAIVSTTSNWQKVTSIVKCTDGTRTLGIASQDGVNPFEAKNLKAFDLTQMFGEGNEPTIEEFEAMFPNSYYEYNKGELMSFDGKGVKSVGFNLFDKTKAKIGVALNDVTGDEGISAVSWCSDFVRILPNTKYHISHVIGSYLGYPVHYYDNNFNHIKGVGLAEITQDNGNEDTSGTFTTPANAVYIRFRGLNSIGYDNVCLNLSHSGYRNGEYEPYQDYKLLFQDGKTISQLTGKLNGEGDSVVIFPDGLRSAGEAFDEIVYDKTTGKHKAIKRIAAVDMGTLSWIYQDIFTCTFKTANLSKNGLIKSNLVTAKYVTDTQKDQTDKTISGISYLYSNVIYKQLYISDSSYTGSDSFKQSLAGQILYYELETPEVYELDNPINTSYEAYDFGTEEVLYNDDKEVNIPMKASIEYGFNAVDMIRNNFEEIRSLKERVTALELVIQLMQSDNTLELLPQE